MSDFRDDLMVEDFKESWIYIRHQEDIRLRLHQMFVVISAAILTVMAALVDASNDGSFAVFVLKNKNVVLAASIFIAFYGSCLTWFMWTQKKSYERYRKLNVEVRRLAYKTASELQDLRRAVDAIDKSPHGFWFESPFVAWSSLTLTITSAAYAVFFATLLSG